MMGAVLLIHSTEAAVAERHLIIGLGNPGGKYAKTRHNVGWWVIDELVRRYELGGGRTEKRARTWDAHIKRQRCKLVKPLTYMNRSGEAVRALLDFYDLPLENLLVIHDDLDTPFGTIRLRKAGGHGGQNGLRNIIAQLGSRDFARLRFGIGRPPGKMRAVDYVLRPFVGDEQIRAQEITSHAADAIEMLLSAGIEKTMTAYNGAARDQNPSPIPPAEQLKIYARAHELNPSDPQPLSRLIAAQKKLGQLDDAAANHLKLAQLYQRGGQSGRSRAEKEKAVAIKPGWVAVQREIAEWYRTHDRPKKAVSRYLILAAHLRDSGQLAAALQTTETALALNPQHPKARDFHSALQALTAGG